MRSASAPMPAANVTQTLFVLRAANLQLTTDQAFSKLGAFTNYIVTNVVAVCKTGGATVVCAGGVYTGAAKSGDQIVAVAQSWVGLTGAAIGVLAGAANLLAKQESATPLLSLTTGSTAAATADFFVQGVVVD